MLSKCHLSLHAIFEKPNSQYEKSFCSSRNQNYYQHDFLKNSRTPYPASYDEKREKTGIGIGGTKHLKQIKHATFVI